MQLLGNCANKNNYDYNEDDVQKIMRTLEEELMLLKQKFHQDPEKKSRFMLE